jgi:hypothetical protein
VEKFMLRMRHDGEEDVVGVGTGGGSGHLIGGLKSYCIQYCDTFQTQNFSPTFLQPSRTVCKIREDLQNSSPKIPRTIPREISKFPLPNRA